MISIYEKHLKLVKDCLVRSCGNTDFRRYKMRKGSACHLLSHWFLARFFDPEDGGDMFLRNVG
jgi:hypothetical protein